MLFIEDDEDRIIWFARRTKWQIACLVEIN